MMTVTELYKYLYNELHKAYVGKPNNAETRLSAKMYVEHLASKVLMTNSVFATCDAFNNPPSVVKSGGLRVSLWVGGERGKEAPYHFTFEIVAGSMTFAEALGPQLLLEN